MEEVKKVNWIRLVITINIILVTSLAVGGTTWYVMDKNSKDEKKAQNESLASMQKQIEDLRKNESGQNKSTSNIYKNTEYGFQLSIPDSWKGYKIFKTSNEGPLPTFAMSLPTTEDWTDIDGVDKGYGSLFAIRVFTKSEWNELAGTPYAYLGENNNFVFAYSLPNSGPEVVGDTKFGELSKESNSVLRSFKIIK